MGDDKIKVDVRADGGSLELRGGLAKQFGDLISPFTNFGRTVGSRVEIWGDLWNFKYAIHAAARAREIADKEGIKIEPKSSKFLKDWALKASLEDDGALIDEWARLLLSASSEFEAADAINLSILAQIGYGEADFMNQLWQKEPTKLDMVFNPDVKTGIILDIKLIFEELDKYYDIDTLNKYIKRGEISDASNFCYKIEEAINSRRMRASSVELQKKGGNIIRIGFAKNDIINNCEFLKLIEKNSLQFYFDNEKLSSKYKIELQAYILSSIGNRFMTAVRPSDS